ncbi:MAG: integrase/recombinase XerC [Luteibaculaceae bacterium]|jgi:integrase/recombinase XerC
MDNRESVRAFLGYLGNERRLSEHTLRSYQTDLDQFSQFLKEMEGSEEETDRSLVRLWLIQLMELGRSPRSIQRKLSALSSWYGYQILHGIRRENPVKGIKAPKLNPELPQFVPASQVASLLASLDWSAEGYQGSLMVFLLYGTGIRRAELIDLKWSDIRGFQVMRVRGKGNKQREVVIVEELGRRLKEFWKIQLETKGEKGSWVFTTQQGEKLYPKFVYREVNKYLGKATSLKKRSPHVLRHSYATHLMENGADISSIQKLLGHSSLNATQVYTHTSVEKIKNIHASFHPRGKGGKLK